MPVRATSHADADIAAVVPATRRHLRHARALLSSMRSWTLLPREIALAVSEVAGDGEALKAHLATFAPPGILFTLTSTADRRTAGENRNAGLEALRTNSEFVAYLDADDYYRRDRLTILLHAAQASGADVVLHSYVRGWPPRLLELLRPMRGTRAISADEFRAAARAGRPNGEISILRGASNVSLPPHCELPLHQGHVLLRRGLALHLRYGSETVGEDGIYLQRLIHSGADTVGLPYALSVYDPLTPRLSARRLARIAASAAVPRDPAKPR